MVEKPSDKLIVRRWDGGHIAIEANNWSCFLHNESLNPLINWMNLHKDDIASGNVCKGEDKNNDVIYTSVNKFVMISKRDDFVFLSYQQYCDLVKWLNNHRKILKTREVISDE